MVDVRGNALPGTVVDRDITTTEPGVFDFYLQSREHSNDAYSLTYNSYQLHRWIDPVSCLLLTSDGGY